jgi:hypothetical protein
MPDTTLFDFADTVPPRRLSNSCCRRKQAQSEIQFTGQGRHSRMSLAGTLEFHGFPLTTCGNDEHAPTHQGDILGQDALCRIQHNGEIHEGKALLETNEIIVRGDFRLKIPFNEITAISASDGQLCVSWSGGETIFHLGSYAAKWADKIKNPPTLLDKLGVKPDSAIRIEGVRDSEFERLLNEADVQQSAAETVDLLFYEVDNQDDLLKLEELKRQIMSNGGIWVISPRGRKEIQDIHVFAAAKQAGLVDVKVCRFSETHTALKLVIPRDKR